MPSTRTTARRSPTRRTRRSLAISTAIVAMFSAAACSSPPEPDHQGVCIDRDTETRVADRECEQGTTGYGYAYFPTGVRYPAVGQSLRSHPGSVPSLSDPRSGVAGGASVSGGVATKSGLSQAVSRGGFGSSSGSNSSGVGG